MAEDSAGAEGDSPFVDKAAQIGGGIGAVMGLFAAIGEASSFMGYATYVIVGAMVGGGIVALFAAALPYIIVIGILALIVQSCT